MRKTTLGIITSGLFLSLCGQAEASKTAFIRGPEGRTLTFQYSPTTTVGDLLDHFTGDRCKNPRYIVGGNAPGREVLLESLRLSSFGITLLICQSDQEAASTPSTSTSTSSSIPPSTTASTTSSPEMLALKSIQTTYGGDSAFPFGAYNTLKTYLESKSR